MMRYPERKKSKKIFLKIAILAVIALAASNLLIKKPSSDTLIAKVNDEKILKSEIDKKLNEIFGSNNQKTKTPDINTLPKEILEILVKEIYLEKKLTKEASKSSLAKDEKIIGKINDAKDRILRQAYIDQITKEQVTQEAINNKYLELSNEIDGKKEYSISHIVFKTKKEAKKTLKKLNSSKQKNKKFTDFAKKHSIDESSAAKGGDLGYIVENSMTEEISNTVAILDKDEISQPIQTKFGWHLIKVNDVRDAKFPPFKLVKDSISNQLSQDVVNEINSKFTDNAKVEIIIPLQNHKEDSPKNKTSKQNTKTKKDTKKKSDAKSKKQQSK